MESIVRDKRMIERNETTESAISYGIGCGTALLGWVCEISDFFTALAVLFGCLIAFVRLVHDGVRLVRFIKKP